MILYATSFNQRLYEATGRAFLEQFKRFQPDNHLLVTTEDDCVSSRGNMSHFSLRDYLPLCEWLKTNEDIIPVEMGGCFSCDCSYHDKFKQFGHEGHCPAGGLRRRASHWIKKFMTWKCADDRQHKQYYQHIVWIDCDTTIKKHIPDSLIEDLMMDVSVGYHYGKMRKHVDAGIETGVTCFNMGNAGHSVIQEMDYRFSDGTFRDYVRWDEAWMLTEVMKDMPGYGVDLTPNSKTTDPVHEGPFAEYIVHHKGIHWKEHGVNG